MWKERTTKTVGHWRPESLLSAAKQPPIYKKTKCKPTDSIIIVCAFQLRLPSCEFHRSFTSLRCSDNCSHTIYRRLSWCGDTVSISHTANPVPNLWPLNVFLGMWLNIVVSWGLGSFQASVASSFPHVSCADVWKQCEKNVNELNAGENVDSFSFFFFSPMFSHQCITTVNCKSSCVLSKASKWNSVTSYGRPAVWNELLLDSTFSIFVLFKEETLWL